MRRVSDVRPPQHRADVVPHHEDPALDRDVAEGGGVVLDFEAGCAHLGVLDGDWRVDDQHLRVAPVKGGLPRGRRGPRHHRVGVVVEGVVARAWMVKGGGIGDAGGGWLEHPRQWLGAQRTDLLLGVPNCPEPSGASCGGTGAELGHC